MTTTDATVSEPFALQFGDLERLLAELELGTRESIVSRFNKLRPKFAPDNILSKPGKRVSYDLTRTLSISAIYLLNSMSVPQADAVRTIVSNWPEFARGFIHAHRSVANDEVTAPDAVVLVHMDAFPSGIGEAASWARPASGGVRGVPAVALDLVSIARALASADAVAPDALDAAFAELERTFGWEDLAEHDAPRLPERLASGFFGTGPYFDRARALVAVEDPECLSRRERMRLQAFLEYLETPPPIDSWKRFIGTADSKPRLHHRLAAVGVGLGLSSSLIGKVDTLQVAWGDRLETLDLIERGEAHLVKLRAVAGV